jgi:hypothetical protein
MIFLLVAVLGFEIASTQQPAPPIPIAASFAASNLQATPYSNIHSSRNPILVDSEAQS